MFLNCWAMPPAWHPASISMPSFPLDPAFNNSLIFHSDLLHRFCWGFAARGLCFHRLAFDYLCDLVHTPVTLKPPLALMVHVFANWDTVQFHPTRFYWFIYYMLVIAFFPSGSVRLPFQLARFYLLPNYKVSLSCDLPWLFGFIFS